MKMLKVVLGAPLLALALTACGQESSEPASQKEETTPKTAVHTKETTEDTTKGTSAVKEATPHTLQTKATNLQKAVDSNSADMDYLMNLMVGYQYIQVGNNEYIYYGINQEQNVFSMMQVTFDNTGNYIQNVNMIDNASASQIATLQSQIQNQQAQLSDLEQQQMQEELGDYYAQLEADQKAQEEADAKAEAEAQAEAEKQAREEEEAQAKADQEAQEQAEEDKKAEEEAAAQAEADAEAAQAEEDAQAQADAEAAKQQQIEAANDAIADMGSWLSSAALEKIQAELASSIDGTSETLDHCYRVYGGTEADEESLFCSNQGQ
jgi:DNA repair exonuclease SbcCD ATPase subunit